MNLEIDVFFSETPLTDRDASERHDACCCRQAPCGEAVEYVMELADKHGLVCFDPKTRSILTAPPGMHLEGQPGAAIWPLTMLTLWLALAGLLLLQ